MRMSKLLGSSYNVGHVDRLLRIFLGIALMALSIWAFKNYSTVTPLKKTINKNVLGWMFLITNLFSCNTIPAEIKIGKDACFYCKMTVSDNRFGVLLVNEKGKKYIFDDTQCFTSFLHKLENRNIKIVAI